MPTANSFLTKNTTTKESPFSITLLESAPSSGGEFEQYWAARQLSGEQPRMRSSSLGAFNNLKRLKAYIFHKASQFQS